MKPRVLLVNEYSGLLTGYSTYGREILSRLYNTGKYEIAELATYIKNSDLQKNPQFPWKIYGNVPENDPKYDLNGDHQFGSYSFEQVCLDFQPSYVCSIRDYWMDAFLYNSPYRPYYNLITMPACDAEPQNSEWLNLYATADAVIGYTDWEIELFNKVTNGKIKTRQSASPAAPINFQPVQNKEKHKNQFGVGGDVKIIGFVSRNQKRKLFPDLFQSFRTFLNETKLNNVLLYCHTSFPDNGWDIPELLVEHGLSNKVLFTYVCRNPKCGHIFPTFFQDGRTSCLKCKQLTACLSNVGMGLSNDAMAAIYNLFDIYIQYSTAEALGMSQVEAAACGVPIMSVDYSAMSEIVKKVGGWPIKVKALSKEVETGCLRAVPDNSDLVTKLINFMLLKPHELSQWSQQTRQLYLQNFGYDSAAQVWMDTIDSIPIMENAWFSKPNLFQPAIKVPPNLNNRTYARWLIDNVLVDHSKRNSYFESRLIRDLNYGNTTNLHNSMYYLEGSALFSRPSFPPFSREDAYNNMRSLRERINYFEHLRYERLLKK